MISKVLGHLHDCSITSGGKIAIAIALLIGTTAITAPVSAQDRPLQFALMGDTGYTSVGIEQFKRLLAAINQTELAFVAHVGDFQTDPRGWNPNPTIGPEPIPMCFVMLPTTCLFPALVGGGSLFHCHLDLAQQ